MANKVTLSDIFPAGDFSNSTYQPKEVAHVIGEGKGVGVNSIFNNYSIFRYSRFGPSLIGYSPDMHYGESKRDASPNQANQTGAQADAQAKFNTNGSIRPLEKTFKDVVNNPDAKTIIDYFKNFKSAEDDALGPTPYSWTDFLWCKYYGLIPNNRLITLRRYPFPVNDSIKTKGAGQSDIMVPTSQAVTWFGEETGNTLSSILPNKLSIAWKQIEVTQQTVEGNEITIKALTELLGKETSKGLIPAITTLLSKGEYSKSLDNLSKILNGEPVNNSATTTLANTAYADRMKDYFNQLYTNGAYWSQIFGPVSVINKTMIRDRGLSNTEYASDITLNFHYSLRSYGNVRPKVAFLDLLANFLELTYMNGQFLNILERYVPQSGSALVDASLNAMISSAINSGNLTEVTNAYGKLLNALKKGIGSSITAYSDDWKAAASGDPSKIKKDLGDLGKNYLALYFGQAMRPLIEKSALNYRPIGEWHLVVGNPLNPIATIGDLICKSVEIKMGDELGPDDFPTEVTFIVTLQMAKPRDSFAYQSMFNLGGGGMYVNSLGAPSSKSNTHDASQNRNGKTDAGSVQKAENANLSLNAEIQTAKDRVKNSYGEKYATNFMDTYFATNSNETVSQGTNTDFSKTKTQTTP